MNLTNEQIAKIRLWEATSEQLADLKKKESEYRKAVIAEMFPQLDEGTNSVNLGASGFRLVAIQPYMYKVDADMFALVKDELEQFGNIQIDELVRYKPELSTRIYKALAGDAKKLMESCVTITPGSCSLKIDTSKRSKNEHA